ncbi:MAG: hypothetical protein AAF721_00095 [Myxococcota bacterium]
MTGRVCLNWTKVSDKGLHLLASKRGEQVTDLQAIHLANATKVGLLQVHGSAIPNAYVTCPAD